VICESDLVRLRFSPEWVGKVIGIEEGEAFVERGNTMQWVPLELLELHPCQQEELAA
jgi:hypothetical protein